MERGSKLAHGARSFRLYHARHRHRVTGYLLPPAERGTEHAEYSARRIGNTNRETACAGESTLAATAAQPPETNRSAADQQSAASAGRDERARTELPEHSRRSPIRAITFTSALRLILPALVVAAVLILGATVYYVRWGFGDAQWHGRRQAVPVWIAFNDIGRIMSSRIGDAADAVPVSGYDGQFYYYLARDPSIMVVCAHR